MNLAGIYELFEEVVSFIENEQVDVRASFNRDYEFYFGDLGYKELPISGTAEGSMSLSDLWLNNVPERIEIRRLREALADLGQLPGTIAPGFTLPSTADPETQSLSTLAAPDSVAGDQSEEDLLTLPLAEKTEKVEAQFIRVGDRSHPQDHNRRGR